MRAMTNSSKVTMDREQVAPKVVQIQRESTNSKGVRFQRESGGLVGESTIQRESTFRYRWERGIFQDY
jgi:hypothetical protein